MHWLFDNAVSVTHSVMVFTATGFEGLVVLFSLIFSLGIVLRIRLKPLLIAHAYARAVTKTNVRNCPALNY